MLAAALQRAAVEVPGLGDLLFARQHLGDGLDQLVARWTGTDGVIGPTSTMPADVETVTMPGFSYDELAAVARSDGDALAGLTAPTGAVVHVGCDANWGAGHPDQIDATGGSSGTARRPGPCRRPVMARGSWPSPPRRRLRGPARITTASRARRSISPRCWRTAPRRSSSWRRAPPRRPRSEPRPPTRTSPPSSPSARRGHRSRSAVSSRVSAAMRWHCCVVSSPPPPSRSPTNSSPNRPGRPGAAPAWCGGRWRSPVRPICRRPGRSRGAATSRCGRCSGCSTLRTPCRRSPRWSSRRSAISRPQPSTRRRNLRPAGPSISTSASTCRR